MSEPRRQPAPPACFRNVIISHHTLTSQRKEIFKLLGLALLCFTFLFLLLEAAVKSDPVTVMEVFLTNFPIIESVPNYCPALGRASENL